MGVVKSDYLSDHAKWMQEQFEKHPHWEADQLAGRAIWWDKKQDLKTSKTFDNAKVPAKPYPYDVNF